jgi:hypothetical protein
VIQFRRPAGFIEHRLSQRGSILTVTGAARLADGQVEYQVKLSGRDHVIHETEQAVLSSFWVTGVTLTDVEFRNGDVYYTVKEL